MQPYFAGVPFHAAPTSRQAVSCHSPLCVSCTKIESPQIRRKLFAFKPGFVTPPILTTPVETFRPTSLLRYAAASTGAVVATGSASVNADCDNGVTLHHTAQPRRGHEHAAKRVEASVVLAQLLAQGTSVEDEVPQPRPDRQRRVRLLRGAHLYGSRALVVPYALEPCSLLPIWLSSFLAHVPKRAVQPHA